MTRIGTTDQSVEHTTNREDSRPSWQHYPQDWMADNALRSVSLAARGLWIDLLCIAWQSPIRGKLLFVKSDGKTICQMNSKMIARLVGESNLELIEVLLRELGDAGVYSVDNQGVIYSRRQVRETPLSEKRAQSGRLGAAKRWDSKPMGEHGNDGSSSSSSTSSSTSSSRSTSKAVDLSSSTRAYARGCGEENLFDLPATTASDTDAMQLFQDRWNAMAVIPGCKARKLRNWPEQRRKAFLARMKDPAWRESWPEALIRIPKCDFLNGKTNNSTWVIGPDFFLRPNSVTKILEGNYDDDRADGVYESSRDEFGFEHQDGTPVG